MKKLFTSLAIAVAALLNAQEQVKQNWFYVFPGTEPEAERLVDFSVTRDGHLTANRLRYRDPSKSELLKFLPSGQILWRRDIPSGANVFATRDGQAVLEGYLYVMGVDADGVENFWQENIDYRTHDFSQKEHALFSLATFRGIAIRRLSPESGGIVWSRAYQRHSSRTDAYLIGPDHKGNVFVGIRDLSDPPLYRLWKLSPSGEDKFLVDTVDSNGMAATWEHETVEYTYALSGSGIRKFGSDGTLLWTRAFGDGLSINYIAVDQETGHVYGLGQNRNFEFMHSHLVAFDRDGNLLWSRNPILGGPLALKVDRHGRVYTGLIHDDLRQFRMKAFATAYNPDGSLVWQLQHYATIGHLNLELDEKLRFYWGSTDITGWFGSYTQAAVAKNDSYSLTSNTPLSVPAPGVVANDHYTASTKAQVASAPASGSVVLNLDGSFTYTVKPGFNGTDTFTYYLDNGLKSNTATVSIRVAVNWLKSLALTNTTVIGGDGTNAIVSLTKAATAPTTVALSSNSSAIQLSATVTFAAGNQTAIAQVKTSAVTTTATRTVTASYDGVSKSASLTLTPGGLKANVISPGSVTGGATATGTLTLTAPAPAGGRAITLTSNSSSIAVPSSVTIPQGASTATYAVQTSPLAQPVTRQVTARLGTVSNTANLTILPAKLSRLTISPSTVKGGTSTTGTVTLTGKTAANLTVNLTSNSSAVVVPSSVVVPAGATSKTFTITTKPVTATATRQVTATQGGVTSTANITLTP